MGIGSTSRRLRRGLRGQRGRGNSTRRRWHKLRGARIWWIVDWSGLDKIAGAVDEAVGGVGSGMVRQGRSGDMCCVRRYLTRVIHHQ